MGESPPGEATSLFAPGKSRKSRLAVFIDLHKPPNPRFHIEFLETLLLAVDRYNFAVTLHQWNPADPDSRTQVRSVLQCAKPDGVVWFRITPNRQALLALHRIPAVVVYGSRLRYPQPVLMHIVPTQTRISDDIKKWARDLHRDIDKSGYVVVAHAPREPEKCEMPVVEGAVASVRNERIDLIEAGIVAAGLICHPHEVPNYAAIHAAELVNRFEDALGFVCLADELAVAVYQLLECRDGTGAAKQRVIGFDHTTMSTDLHMSSFSQNFQDVGAHVAEAFNRVLREHPRIWPEFKEHLINVHLVS